MYVYKVGPAGRAGATQRLIFPLRDRPGADAENVLGGKKLGNQP
jgi:hypothetical protein